MFSMGELEAARDEVHAVFPGKPQYAWPLLAGRTGGEVWVTHENGSVKNLGRYAARWIAGWPKRPSSTAALT